MLTTGIIILFFCVCAELRCVSPQSTSLTNQTEEFQELALEYNPFVFLLMTEDLGSRVSHNIN